MLVASLSSGAVLTGDLHGAANGLVHKLAVARQLEQKNESVIAGMKMLTLSGSQLRARLQEQARVERQLRLSIAQAKSVLASIVDDEAQAGQHLDDVQHAIVAEQERLAALAREQSGVIPVMLSWMRSLVVEPTPVIAASGSVLDDLLSEKQSTLEAMLHLRADAKDAAAFLQPLTDKHEAALQQIAATATELTEAEKSLLQSNEQLRELRFSAAEVTGDMLGLQSDLQDIDRRLEETGTAPINSRARLLSGGTDTDSQFRWPVTGPLGPGFADAAYAKFFGVPHEGQDILVPQGTPVHAPADGIVFVVRLGGPAGYTYVLVGHRGGIATLYGHLSSIAVHAGDLVKKGEVIGLSGGTPGTDGAGLMTTGPHLHVEVFVDGVHINPLLLFP